MSEALVNSTKELGIVKDLGSSMWGKQIVFNSRTLISEWKQLINLYYGFPAIASLTLLDKCLNQSSPSLPSRVFIVMVATFNIQENLHTCDIKIYR